MIQAIETVYNGYRFRSRLEARWAVFFDNLGVKYVYEPEGYKLSNGETYLPDFYLPDFNIYTEIKADRKHDNGLSRLFAFEASGFDDGAICGGVLVCYGQPSDHDLRFITASEADDNGGGEYDTDWGPHGSVRFAKGEDGWDWDEVPLILIDDNWPGRSFCWTKNIYAKRDWPWYSDVEQAELKARQARFEHGEKP